MTSAFIAVALAATLRSLWIRRDTWRSRWEVGVSLTVALHGCAVLFMSPWAAALFGSLLQRVFGRWNVQHLLGHICLILAAIALIRHVLLRLAEQPLARALFARQVMPPVTLGIPALLVLFIVADEDYHPDLLAAPAGTAWFVAYWLVLCGLLIYLFGYTGRLLLILRADPRSKQTTGMYLVALALAVAGSVIQVETAWAGVDLALPVWLLGSLSVVGFAHGAARSWQARTAWFNTGHPVAPQSQPA